MLSPVSFTALVLDSDLQALGGQSHSDARQSRVRSLSRAWGESNTCALSAAQPQGFDKMRQNPAAAPF